jgi:subtilisin-like proprotein convertase family protein
MHRISRVFLVALLVPLTSLIAAAPAGAAPVTFSYTGPPVPIPDAADLSGVSPGAPANATIAVAGLGSVITDVNFRIDGTSCSAAIGSTTVGIDHTFVNDLEIRLTSPGGTTVTLIDNTDGDGNNFCQTLLDDDATGAPSIQSAVTANAPFTGTWLPANPLSAFDLQNPNGNWTVTVQDFFSTDTGNLRAVSIIIDATTPEALCALATPPAGARVGTAGQDEITGTPGNDVIFGLAGNDNINGLGGNDIICAGDGNDLLQGGDGNDILVGGAGNDRLLGQGDNDVLLGQAGFDYLDGGAGTNTVDGGTDNDFCTNGTQANCP